MKTFALVGKSGTGKSFRSLDIAHKNNIEAVIDDGLLISHNRVLAGKSAKHENSRMASVKRAIFAEDSHVFSIKSAILSNNIGSVLILGTSEKMVNQIAQRLDLLPIEKIFYIEDIATPEEIKLASNMRNIQGKHIIPVPVFEVKKQFSGYFLRSLFPHGRRDKELEKTIMRPTYSYLGNFRIAPKVFSDICKYEVSKIDDVSDVLKVKSISDTDNCIDIYIDVCLDFPCDIPQISTDIQSRVSAAIEDSTSIIVNNVNVFIKSLSNM
ncbi:MAG: Asp23/Gls24 family envelope stress response protein [Clostridia bacterium]|nr:Asp23/Gls24 family envelope stress response protein [Clostridia bacterium]